MRHVTLEQMLDFCMRAESAHAAIAKEAVRVGNPDAPMFETAHACAVALRVLVEDQMRLAQLDLFTPPDEQRRDAAHFLHRV